MGKRTRRHTEGAGGGALAEAKVRAGLRKAEDLFESDEPAQALEVARRLVEQVPARQDVLEAYLEFAQDAADDLATLDAAERLLALGANEALLHLVAGQAAIALTEPFTAKQHLEAAIAGGLPASEAKQARRQLEVLEASASVLLAQLHLEGPEAEDLARMHEHTHLLLMQGRWSETRAAAAHMLARRPDFAAARNNLGQAAWAQADLVTAEAAWRRVLDTHPDNVHALANLAQLLFLRGEVEAARALVARMDASPSAGSERFVKMAEAHSMLGDDAGVLACADAAAKLPPSQYSPGGWAVLHHFAAVAALRQGDEARARKEWRAAVALPGVRPDARQQLTALDELPAPLRPLPWFRPVEALLPPPLLERVEARLASAKERMGAQVTVALLREVPTLEHLLPVLLDRGDPRGVKLALDFLWHSGDPRLLEACRDFALGKRGSVLQRSLAARCLVHLGSASREELLLWTGRSQTPWAWFDFEVEREAARRHGPEVARLAQRSALLLEGGQFEEAEGLLRRALELEPESPDLHHNLAVAHQQRGHVEEGFREVEAIHARWPDYLFASVGVACARAQAGRTDEARSILRPALGRRRYHLSEVRALTTAMVTLLVAEGDRDSAAVWVTFLGAIDPDAPELPSLWQQAREPGLLGKLLGR